jgi:hypothetical protein
MNSLGLEVSENIGVWKEFTNDRIVDVSFDEKLWIILIVDLVGKVFLIVMRQVDFVLRLVCSVEAFLEEMAVAVNEFVNEEHKLVS